MREYFALCSDGGHTTYIVRIEGDVQMALGEKKNYPHWHLSIYPTPYGIQDRKLDCNSMTPFFIYGAELVQMVFDSDGEIHYSTWSGKYKEAIEMESLNEFRRFLVAESKMKCLSIQSDVREKLKPRMGVYINQGWEYINRGEGWFQLFAFQDYDPRNFPKK